jgi:hypothetical protein
LGGYAFGVQRPEAEISLETNSNELGVIARLYYNKPRDIGPIAGMPGALNTLTSAFGGTDYTDYYFTRGGSFTLQQRAGKWLLGETVFAEVQRASSRAAYRTDDGVQPGTFFGGGFQFDRKESSEETGLSWNAHGSASIIHYEGKPGTHFPQSGNLSFARLLGSVDVNHTSADKRFTADARFHAGLNSTQVVPPQMRFLIGGRETVPTYNYRGFEGPVFLRETAIWRAPFGIPGCVHGCSDTSRT